MLMGMKNTWITRMYEKRSAFDEILPLRYFFTRALTFLRHVRTSKPNNSHWELVLNRCAVGNVRLGNSRLPYWAARPRASRDDLISSISLHRGAVEMAYLLYRLSHCALNKTVLSVPNLAPIFCF